MDFFHTYSIVARISLTGQLGVAVQTHWFAVGALCPWVEAGVGAIATQSMVEVSYGPKGLALLRSGLHPRAALDELLGQDEGRETRQVAFLNGSGEVAVHTGSRCIAYAGHHIGSGYAVQANMMASASVWPAMAEAFESSRGDLASRMLASLKAGQAAGGDVRGCQSACMRVVGGVSSDEPWKHMLVDIRVDDHPRPLEELSRLLDIQQAYHLMNAGYDLIAQGKSREALDKYTQAARLAAHIDEIPFWQAVTLADNGFLEDALPIFRQVFAINPGWAALVSRLPDAGLLKKDTGMMGKILAMQNRNEGI